MKVFLDTNVIVDVITRREPFFEDSQAILALCANGELEGAISDLTFCNVAYVLRKQVGNDRVRECLRILKRQLKIVSVGETAIQSALDDEAVDFEDAVQIAAAANWGAELILTRNVRHFRTSPIRVVTPTDYLTEP